MKKQCPKPSAGLKVGYPPSMNPHLYPEGSPPSDPMNAANLDMRGSGSKPQQQQQGPVLAKPPSSPRSKDPNSHQRAQQFMQQQFQQLSTNTTTPSPPQQVKITRKIFKRGNIFLKENLFQFFFLQKFF